MDNEYSVPSGAKPWTPSVVAAPESRPEVEEPKPKAVDASRLVSGLATSLEKPEIVEPEAPKASEVVDLTKAEESEEPIEGPVESKLCPACGAMIDSEFTIEITEDDKNRWLRHILGEARFKQTYEVYNGRMQVTFRSRTTEENDMLFKQLTHEINNDLLPEAPYFASPAYVARMNRLMLILSLERVIKYVENDQEELEPRPVVYPLVSEATYSIKDTDYVTPLGRAHEELLRGLDENLVAVLMTLLRRFDTMTSMLVMRSSESDFWTPAGGGR